ncbi:hypothetical protein D9M71_279660 [compost metagenome]
MRLQQAEVLRVTENGAAQLVPRGLGGAAAQLEAVRHDPLLAEDLPLVVEEQQEVEVLVPHRVDIQVGVGDLVAMADTDGVVERVRPGGDAQHVEAAADEAVELEGEAVGLALQLLLFVGVEAGQQLGLGQYVGQQQRHEDEGGGKTEQPLTKAQGRGSLYGFE